MKICFCATENLYDKLAIVITSLLHFNPDVETIYLCLEHDEWPYIKDDRIKVINISKLDLDISPLNPNLNRACTYMSLIRAYLPIILTDEDRIISSDCDVLFNGSIRPVWEWDLRGNYAAATPEWRKSLSNELIGYNIPYVNVGFTLMDLKAMREHHIVDQMIDLMNVVSLGWPDQDALNIICRDHISLLPYKYNSNIFTGIAKFPIVIHGTPIKPWTPDSEFSGIWQHYKEMYMNEYSIENSGEDNIG